MAEFYLDTENEALLEPQAAIVVYAPSPQHPPSWATHHPIIEGQLGPGTTLDAITLKEALNALLGQTEGTRWIDERLLVEGPELLVWWEPAKKRRLFFQPDFTGPVAERLKALSGTLLPQPPLIFVKRPYNLVVYALARNERPGPNARLYHPPYYNTAKGLVCLGSTPLEADLDPSKLTAYTEAFFASAFTHPWSMKTRFPGDHAAMWERARKIGRFAKKWLAPAGKTLGEVVKEATRGRV